MESNWDFYFTRVNETTSSIGVDLALYERVPLVDKPIVVQIGVDLNIPRADGLVGKEEAATLREIELALQSAVQTCADGVLVGRVTVAGTREFYFYAAHDNAIEVAAENAMRAFPDYRFEVLTDQDPEWNHYREVLYPSSIERQRMNNRRALEKLAQHGDCHELPRELDHLMRFRSTSGRDVCCDVLLCEGYRISAQEELHEVDGAMPYSLEFHRDDAIDWKTIDALTLKLCALAEQHDGAYVGWGCDVTDREVTEYQAAP